MPGGSLASDTGAIDVAGAGVIAGVAGIAGILGIPGIGLVDSGSGILWLQSYAVTVVGFGTGSGLGLILPASKDLAVFDRVCAIPDA